MATLGVTELKHVYVMNERKITAAENLTEALMVSQNSSTNDWEVGDPSDANLYAPSGIALSDIDVGDTGLIAGDGSVFETNLSSMTVGDAFYMGVGGIIIPIGDLTVGHKMTLVALAISTSAIIIAIKSTGINKP